MCYVFLPFATITVENDEKHSEWTRDGQTECQHDVAGLKSRSVFAANSSL